MSLSCNSELRAQLNAVAHKLAWCDVLNAELGNTRRIRCFRDPDPAAANPFATGTEFRNVGSTGPLTTAAGQIIGLGKLDDTQIALPADMASGKSILRIEGTDANGQAHWIQGTLGLSADAQTALGASPDQIKTYDFTVGGNFTANNGLAVKPGLAISGPRFLPSGTGPAAPDVTADAAEAPYLFEVWNWEDENAPFLVGTTKLDRREDDFVYEDAKEAATKGDIAVWQTTSGVLHWQHEFGFTLLASHAGNTESGTKPLYQVIGAAAVRGDWVNYPEDTYWDKSKHTAFPKPFKIVMKSRNGTVLHTFEMHDGLPINSPQCSQSRTATTPLRPHWDCAQQLPWSNEVPKRNPNIESYWAGIHPRFRRPSISKKNYSFNGVEPMITGGYQNNNMNGIHHMFATPQWPMPDVDMAQEDPYLDDFNARWPPHANSWDGWDYEPGSFTQHNRYTGPGGVRQDRGHIPSILAWYITDPDGTRLQGSVPHKEWAWKFSLAYANHSGHWCRNPNTLQLAKDNRELFYDWKMSHEYYSSHYYANPLQIDVRADMRDGDNDSHRDYTGHFVWNGSGRDGLHMYCQAGWASLIFNSPMHTIMGKWDAFYGLKGGGGNWNPRDMFMVRSMAWIWLHYAIMWKLASKHRLGWDRAMIEQMFSDHLKRVYEDIYLPIEVNNEQSLYADGIRRFGTNVSDEGSYHGDMGGGLGFYIGQVMVLMKQIGLWDVMQAKGGHNKIALDYQITVMDRKSVAYIADTRANLWQNGYTNFVQSMPLPQDWNDYVNSQTQWFVDNWKHDDGSPDGQGVGGMADMFHGPDGSLWSERDVSNWPLIGYIYSRRDYFPEYANPKVATAIAKLDGWLDEVKNSVNAQSNPADQRSRDHTYAWGAVAPIAPPAKIGP